MIQAHAESNTGPVRTVNEDSWLIQGELGLFAVADGMGGHNAGEVASRLALDALSGFIGRMGTTLVSVLVHEKRVIVGHVGDSRVYRLTDGELSPVTQDDSWAAALRSQGLTPAELAHHPMRHVLTNVVGARDQVNVHISEFPLVDGDAYLLCSDGLYEPLGDDGIRQILSDGADPARAAASLVREALEKGSRDNVTALVVRVGSAP